MGRNHLGRAFLVFCLTAHASFAAPLSWDNCAAVFRSLFERPAKKTAPPLATPAEQASPEASTEPEPFKVIRQNMGSLTAHQVSESEAVIFSINEMYAGHLKTPTSILLDLRRNDGGSFKHRIREDVGRVESSFQLARDKKSGTGKFTKHPTHSRAILAHEYGHAVFFESMRLRSEKFALAMNKWPSYWEFDHYPQTMRMHDMIEPYNELFADLTAVLQAKDLSAMRKSFSFSGMSEADRKGYLLRDFAARNTNATPIPTTRRGVPIPHALLGRTRSFLGSNILTNPLYRNEPGATAAKVLNAIALEIEERYTNPDLQNLSVQTMNDRLIEKLAKEFP
ncbi:MAG: hypothetical protein JST16_04735 [Bdellovibrionales bacterium]|nr:hypothetical protein [Bdellovibrionales bacterium]